MTKEEIKKEADRLVEAHEPIVEKIKYSGAYTPYATVRHALVTVNAQIDLFDKFPLEYLPVDIEAQMVLFEKGKLEEIKSELESRINK